MLPLTPIDWIARTHPEFHADLLSLAKRGDGPVSNEELMAQGGERAVMAHMERAYPAALKRAQTAQQTLGLDAEAAAKAFDEVMQRLFVASSIYADVAVNFALGGQKTFLFKHNLVERLANTELNVPARLIELPFPSCQFIFTDPITSAAALRMTGAEEEIAGVECPVFVYLKIHGDTVARKLVITSMAGRFKGAVPQNRLSVARVLDLSGRTLEDVLRTDHGTLDDPSFAYAIKPDTFFYTTGLQFYRIVLNAVLYLGSSQPDVSGVLHDPAAIGEWPGISSKRRREMEAARKALSQHRYIEVGGTLSPMGGEPSQRQLITRFLVRGHWRYQAHGPGRKERKLIFIAPHWKGPELGPEINRPYRVGL